MFWIGTFWNELLEEESLEGWVLLLINKKEGGVAPINSSQNPPLHCTPIPA